MDEHGDAGRVRTRPAPEPLNGGSPLVVRGAAGRSPSLERDAVGEAAGGPLPARGEATDRDEVSPIPISPRVRTGLVVAGLVALLWLLWSAPTVPRLLLGGGVLALVLSFPVRLLSRRMPRPLAILLVVAGLLVVAAVVLPLLIVTAVDQLTQLVGAVPGYAAEAETWLRGVLTEVQRRGWMAQGPDDVFSRLQEEAIARGQTAAQWLLGQALGAASGTVGTLFQLFGFLFVAVYLLADFGRFKRASQGLVAARYRDDVAMLWRALDQSLSRYLGGLLLSVTIQGVAATVALTLLGVPYALLLGLWMSVTAVLPYVGAFLGAIPAVAAALFVSPLTAVGVALVYLAINQFEGNLLTPRIQGDAVRVHPLLIFLAVVAGGQVAGLLGAALAVPALAIGRVMVDFFGERLYVRRGEMVGAGSGGRALGPGTAVGDDPERVVRADPGRSSPG